MRGIIQKIINYAQSVSYNVTITIILLEHGSRIQLIYIRKPRLCFQKIILVTTRYKIVISISSVSLR